MSSIEAETKSSIRLSTLNPQVREKLVKFDTTNDGELSLEEAIQGLVALQKQSNNYKKMIYILAPTMLLMIASIFGVNMLALNLTKDLHSTTSNSVNVLSNKAGNVLATSSYTENVFFDDWLNNKYSPSINTINFGDLTLNVNAVFLDKQYNTTRIYISTPFLYFYVGSDMTFDVGYTSENNGFSRRAYDIVYSSLFDMTQTYNTKSLLSSDTKTRISVNIGNIADTRGFGCGLLATTCK